jgi:nucleoside-diphosphate-sugar epimerase
MILLTGGTGLVGSQLLFDLASAGKKVRAIHRKESQMNVVDRLFSAFPEHKKNIEWFEGDVLDQFSLEESMVGIDTIYHSAAYISFYPSERSKMMKTNVEGVANMVNVALKKNIKRFCHISSTASLGRVSGDELLDENSWWKTSKDNSNYSISKYGGEREVWRGIEEGLNAFIVNPSIVIGPGNWKSGSTQMFSQVWKGLPFYTEGVGGFVDVRDVSRSAIALMEKGVSNERYILNSENETYRYVFDCIAESLGKKKAYIKVTPFLSELGWRLEKIKSLLTNSRPMITKETAHSGMMQFHYSNEKIKKETGIEFISVKESVKNAAGYFLKDIGVI